MTRHGTFLKNSEPVMPNFFIREQRKKPYLTQNGGGPSRIVSVLHTNITTGSHTFHYANNNLRRNVHTLSRHSRSVAVSHIANTLILRNTRKFYKATT